jgi:sarcosine oxidase
VSAGAWLPGLVGGAVANHLRVFAQTLFWFAPEDNSTFTPGQFPIFIWRHGAAEDDHFYGFPSIGGEVKLASEQFELTTTPDAPRMAASPADAARFHDRHVRGRLRGVSGRSRRAVNCLYTVTPDFGFLIDRHPDWERVLLVSACSGHGFKHSAAIGEALAEQLVEGASRLGLRPFGLGRFDSVHPDWRT